MRQGFRLFVRPDAFVNQLQWSSHHSFILFVFLITAGIEVFVGGRTDIYHTMSEYLARQSGMTPNSALAFVLAGRLLLVFFEAFVLASVLWFIGSLIGRSTSRRVLFRRLAVVFTVLLIAYTIGHLENEHPMATYLSMFFYAWAGLLGLLTLKHQFDLNLLESSVMSVLAFALVVTGWRISNESIENLGSRMAKEMATRQKVTLDRGPIQKIR